MANLEFRNFPQTRVIGTGDLMLFQTDPAGAKNYSGMTVLDFMTFTTFPRLYIGIGSPEGTVVAISGSIYTDASGPSIYMKLSGTGSAGWS